MAARIEELAEAGYVAYGNAVDWIAHTGQPMLIWQALPERQRQGWRAATEAVRAATLAAGTAPAGG